MQECYECWRKGKCEFFKVGRTFMAFSKVGEHSKIFCGAKKPFGLRGLRIFCEQKIYRQFCMARRESILSGIEGLWENNIFFGT